MGSGFHVFSIVLTASVAFVLPNRQAVFNAPAILTQGGPDSYGYRFIDNINEDDGPSYSSLWEDISSSGTNLPMSGYEGGTGFAGYAIGQAFEVPFLIRFYGQYWGTPPQGANLDVVSRSITATTNCILLLPGRNQPPPGSGQPWNKALPTNENGIVQHGLIAPFWNEGQTTTNSSCRWQVVGSAPNRRLLVQWTGWGFWAEDGVGPGNPYAGNMTVQVQITENSGVGDSQIHFIYQTVDADAVSQNGRAATIGIQAPGGTSALEYSYDTAGTSAPASDGTPRVIHFHAYIPGTGSPPNPVPAVAQIGTAQESSLQADAQAAQVSGWTGDQIAFSANVTDPILNQQVLLRVRVRRDTASAWTWIDSGLQPQGTLTVPYDIPSSGDYDWEYRVENSLGESYPANPFTVDAGWIRAFSNGRSPDFRSDQQAPSPPRAIAPSGNDVKSPISAAAMVTFTWAPSLDNGPTSALRYEIEVYRDRNFFDVEAMAQNLTQTSAILSVAISEAPKYWRVRTRDVGGNVSNWSFFGEFRAVFDDGINHASGDATKACGFGAGAGPSPHTSAILGFTLLAIAVGWTLWRRRKIAWPRPLQPDGRNLQACYPAIPNMDEVSGFDAFRDLMGEGMARSQVVRIAVCLVIMAAVSAVPAPSTSAQAAPGLAVAFATGGPDSFGYRFIDSQEADGPVFATEWENISTTGTAINAADWQTYSFYDASNEGMLEVPIGFSFPFYGNSYTTTWVNTNLFLKFGGQTTPGDAGGSYAWAPSTLPSTRQTNMIAVKLEDDNQTMSARYATLGTAPNRRFIVHWTGNGGNGLSMEAKIYENGEIIILYERSTNSTSCTGLNDSTGTVGLLYQFQGSPNAIANNLAIRFFGNSPPNVPSGLIQAATSGGAAKPAGFVSDATVYFRGTVTDPNTSNSLGIQAEILPASTPWSSEPTGSLVQTDAASLVGSGQIAEAAFDFSTTTLPSGDYHWRARTFDNAGAYSGWVVISQTAVHFSTDMIPPTPPTPHSPNGDLLIFPQPSGDVDFSWGSTSDTGPPGPVGYRIQIANSNSFGEVLYDSTVATQSVTVNLPAADVPYFWRVSGVDQAGNNSAPSAPSTFEIGWTTSGAVEEDRYAYCGAGLPAKEGRVLGMLAICIGLLLVSAAFSKWSRRQGEERSSR